MTEQEALTEAQRLWGDRAQIKTTDDGKCAVGETVDVPDREPGADPLSFVHYVAGDTWEDAFANVEKSREAAKKRREEWDKTHPDGKPCGVDGCTCAFGS